MAPKITLYTVRPSQNAIRTELALREKGLDFERIEVDLFNGEHRRPPVSELTPRLQLPVLVYDDGSGAIPVYESIATIRFIDDMFPDPPLLPPASEPRRRADALIRIEEFQAKLDPRNVFGSVIFGGQNRDQLGSRVDDLFAELDRWEAYTKGRSFLAGDQFTLADIAVFPLLMHFEALGFDYERRTPSLAAYRSRCMARSSVVASGFVDAFREFVSGRAPKQVLAD